MSSGSCLTILKRYTDERNKKFNNINEVIKYISDKKSQQLSKHNTKDVIKNHIDSLTKHLTETLNKNFNYYCIDSDLYIDKSLNIWDELICCGFTSEFTQLIEYYHMSSYDSERSHIEFSNLECDNIMRSINYLIKYYGKYDKDIEKLLNTDFVKVFGDYISDYSFSEDLSQWEKEEDERHINSLDNFLTLCKTYQILLNENFDSKTDYKLIYYNW